MAQKRMFDKAIIRTDKFLDMAPSTQNLYFHLGMEADDEGFVTPKMVMRTIGANQDELAILIAKGFVIPFESGVVVITDWNKNNWLDQRRIKRTEHVQEKGLLALTEDNKYVLSKNLHPLSENLHLLNQCSVEECSKTTANAGLLKIEPDTEYEVVPEKPKAQKDSSIPKYEALLRWSESRRGFPFVGRTKQYAAFKKARASDISITRLKDRWQELEGEPWRDGFDWTSVLSTFDKRA